MRRDYHVADMKGEVFVDHAYYYELLLTNRDAVSILSRYFAIDEAACCAQGGFSMRIFRGLFWGLAGLSLAMLFSFAEAKEAKFPVCERTPVIKEVLEDTFRKPCAEITDGDLTEIGEVTLWDLGDVRFKRGDFSGFTGARLILIGDSEIQEMPECLFEDLPGLYFLSLPNNKLKNIRKRTFCNLESLRELSLAGNHIEEIFSEAFHNLPQLVELTVSSNRISRLSSDFFYSVPHLERLILSSNQLTHLKGAPFRHLTKLVNLDLGYNPIESLSIDDFAGLSSLRSLGLYYNRIKTIAPETFRHLQSLTDIALNGNRIEVLPDGVFKELVDLSTIGLEDNQLKRLPKDFAPDSPWLVRLRLGSNPIEDLEALSELSLRSLSLNGLGWTDLSKLLTVKKEALADIRRLFLKNNQLKSLPKGFFQTFPLLEDLNLSKNAIEEFPLAFLQGSLRIKTLNLNNNLLKNIPEQAFVNMPRLGELYFQQNKIAKVAPTAFRGLGHLFALSFSDNQISHLPAGLFDGLESIRALHLQKNRIKEVRRDTFKGLSNLEYLVLSENEIEALDLSAVMPQNFEQMRKIYLNGNRLSDPLKRELQESWGDRVEL